MPPEAIGHSINITLVFNQIWSKGTGYGRCYPLEDITYKELKNNAFLYQYIILTSDIFSGGPGVSRNPKDPHWSNQGVKIELPYYV